MYYYAVSIKEGNANISMETNWTQKRIEVKEKET